jgi:hydroxymethylbilane synthase
MSNKIIRIGTRESQLAIWQATWVQSLLKEKGIESELVFVKSEGDIDLVTPLYEMGVQGIFTRTLDIALLKGEIDIAVHSMKDVPTILPKGIVQTAVLPRGKHQDILVLNDNLIGNVCTKSIGSIDDQSHLKKNLLIATSSIRRKAQWLHRFPYHSLDSLRGNVNTRIQKLNDSNWNGAIFAYAGLDRIGILPSNFCVLDWMLPAPAQGAVVVVANENDKEAVACTTLINDAATALSVKIERDFLRALLGGCTTPISAYVQVVDQKVYFKGQLLSLDGKNKVEIEEVVSIEAAETFGVKAAQYVIENGGAPILESIRNQNAS